MTKCNTFLIEQTQNLVDIGEVQITDAQEALENEAKDLRAKGASLIIGLGNVGFEQAKSMLENLDNVDIIVSGGGHSTFLYSLKGMLSFITFLEK